MTSRIALPALLLAVFAPTSAVAQTAQAETANSAPSEAVTPIDAAGGMASLNVPPGWQASTAGTTTVLTPPEGDVTFALLPIAGAKDGDDAVAKAWAAFAKDFSRPVRIAQDAPGRDGWDGTRVVNYDTPPAEARAVQAVALRKGEHYLVVLVDGAIATLAKRSGQVGQAFGSLRPKGFEKESFAGRTAHPLDAARIAEIESFVRDTMTRLKIPGVGLALIENGRIVYEGGLGLKDAATKAPVDAHTRFMIASNTKGMATLLLATLVDEGKLDWNRPVIDYMPEFRLGNPETTGKVLVRHLVCACTGLPRKDMEWLFNTRPDTPATATWTQLAATEPTSGFGEVFQYNNLMATAAGYLGARILYPDMELGAAFDRVMQERIFDPLGMADTTLSNPAAMDSGNWAKPYATTLTGTVGEVPMANNATIIPYRPAGGAWSSAHDMALYVMDELSEGVAASGKRIVSAKNLLERRVHNVPVGDNVWYGMGLFENRSDGVSVITHGGSLFGYQSNWYAIPSAGVGAVVLTNSDDGRPLVSALERKLLEVLYDGKPEAAENIVAVEKQSAEGLAKLNSELLPVPADIGATLAGTYGNAALGPLTVTYANGKARLDTTSLGSEFALRKNPDGTMSIVTTSPGFVGQDLLVATREGKTALILNDAQHEYAWLKN